MKPRCFFGSLCGIRRWIAALWLLNVIDGFSTFFALATGLVKEANPLMRLVYDADPIAFLGVKTVIMTVLCAMYWQGMKEVDESKSSFRYVLYGLVTIYTCIFLEHSYFWGLYWFT